MGRTPDDSNINAHHLQDDQVVSGIANGANLCVGSSHTFWCDYSPFLGLLVVTILVSSHLRVINSAYSVNAVYGS